MKKLQYGIILAMALMMAACTTNISPDTYSVDAVGDVTRSVPGVIISARPVNVEGTQQIGGLTGAVAGGVHLVHQLLRYRLFSRQRFHHIEHTGARAGSVHAHAQRPGVVVQAVRCFHRVAAALPDGRALAVCALPGFHHELVLHPAHGKAVIIALLYKADKVIAGLRGLFRGALHTDRRRKRRKYARDYSRQFF